MTFNGNPIMGEDYEEEGDLVTVTRKKFKRPPRYKVILHNDDYTTMEFVVYVLKVIFGKSDEEAHEIMLTVHNQGRGVCGVYTHEVAESKMQRVSLEAKENGHPLLCTMEPE
jgi:ATP-dependent Clp protease adaptor protein ClpS